MLLKELLNAFDDWNRNVKINKHHPDTPVLMQGRIVDVVGSNASFCKRLMQAKVVSFGHYNDLLCVRVVYQGRKAK